MLALATQECIKQKTGAYAVPVKQTSFTCRLFIPNHFYFRCEGTPPAQNEQTQSKAQ